jgi:hypothetical protein
VRAREGEREVGRGRWVVGTRRELTRTDAFVSREAAEEAAEEGLVCAESDRVVGEPVEDAASSSTLQRTCIIHKYE